MTTFRIADGRERLWQYDTGVQFALVGCQNVTECHFSTPDGVISREVVDGVCSVPDVALQTSGMLRFYAFERTEDGGTTRHDFRVLVNERPKPADYIDPPDEADTIDLIAKRVVELIDIEPDEPVTQETDPTVPDWAKQPNKPTYTAAEVGAADKAQTEQALNSLNEEKANKADIPAPYTLPTASAEVKGGVKVGSGLQMDGDVLGIVPEGGYELIETITLTEDTTVIERTQEPDGAAYSYTAVAVVLEAAASSDTSSANKYVGIKASMTTAYLLAMLSQAIRTARVDSAVIFDTAGGYWRAYGYMPNNAYSNVGSAFFAPPSTVNKIPAATRIYRITIEAMYGVVIPAGSIVRIWGVRANA